MKRIVIVGAGPAGLMAAHELSGRGYEVNVYDAKKAAGRKFLVAGHGGFNLTHEGELDQLQEVYDHIYIKEAVAQFGNDDTVAWLKSIGIPTFVGTSGKIFPERGIKPIQVLNNWLRELKRRGAHFFYEHRLVDLKPGTVIIESVEGREEVQYDYLVIATGGASWKKTGSDGKWQELFRRNGIEVVDFAASNAGINLINWESSLAGEVLKNIAVSINGRTYFGELVLTSYGVEGAPVYALSGEVRKGAGQLLLDLKPGNSIEQLTQKLDKAKGNRREQLRALKLSKGAVALLKRVLDKDSYLDNGKLAKTIKSLPLDIDSLRPVEETISTVGGVHMNGVTGSFELRTHPNSYCVGEMLNWDAPTGGYLLQACFATGYVAARSIHDKISQCAEG